MLAPDAAGLKTPQFLKSRSTDPGFVLRDSDAHQFGTWHSPRRTIAAPWPKCGGIPQTRAGIGFSHDCRPWHRPCKINLERISRDCIMQKAKLILVGNGMAGVRTLEELLKLAPDLYDITVYGAEPHGNYNRILLSPVLAGEMKLPEIMLNDVGWYAQHGITLHTGRRIVRIDRPRRTVVADDGSEERYDRLLLATGSTPVMLPIPGHDLPGVLAYRDIADTEAMIAASARGGRAVVIGAGLLGLEAANGLKARGMEVTVVHLAPWIMERQLDKTAADMLQASLEARGLAFLLEKQTVELAKGPKKSGGRVAAVRFADGSEIPADLVVMAIGIRPNTKLAEEAGLHCNRGIVVNDTLQTYDPRIYAVGECVAHRGTAYGLVAPLFEQGKVAANHLAEFGIARYSGSAVSTKLKVTGIDVFSAGDFIGGADDDEIVLADKRGGVYKKLVLRDNRIVGAVLYGDTADSNWYFQLMKEKKCVGPIRDRLMLGQSHQRRRPRGQEPRRRAARRLRGVRLQRREEDHHRQGHQGKGPVHPRGSAQAHQGLRLLRLVHRAGRADPRLGGRRRLPAGGGGKEAAVRLHRLHARGSAQGHRRQPPADHPRGDALPRMAHAERLRQVPAGAQLLPASATGRRNMPTTTSRASSTSASTPISRRTAPIRWCRACGAASPRRPSCAPSPRWSTSSPMPTVKVTGGQRIDLLGIEEGRSCRPSGPTSAWPASSRATPMPRACAP
jgi:NADPH-dependent 2,4-dienoyl-CoA reductase/sulfur reductase-like enzyme